METEYQKSGGKRARLLSDLLQAENAEISRRKLEALKTLRSHACAFARRRIDQDHHWRDVTGPIYGLMPTTGADLQAFFIPQNRALKGVADDAALGTVFCVFPQIRTVVRLVSVSIPVPPEKMIGPAAEPAFHAAYTRWQAGDWRMGAEIRVDGNWRSLQ